MKTHRAFPAKILLLGEYTVLDGGEALAIPFDHFTGALRMRDHEDERFYDLFKHIDETLDQRYKPFFKKEQLLMDIENGLCFDSDIPVGYGVGSSGTLSAAIYAAYFDRVNLTDKDMVMILQTIEGLFHGKSSGVDPLVAYLNKPIHIKSSKQFKIVENDMSSAFNNFYLYDSCVARSTATLVNEYRDIKASNDYFNKCFVLADKVKLTIEKVIDNLYIDNLMREISILQLELFSAMIPEDLTQVWEKGIEDNAYFMKLCGAGGGGFFLVYVPPGIDIYNHLAKEKLTPLGKEYE